MLLTWLQPTPGWVLPGASLDLNFAAGTYYPAGVDSLLTVTRAQTVSSYATTSTGSLTAFAANTPRITDLGLLVEQAATNLQLRSQQFSVSPWAPGNGGGGATAPTVTDNQAVAPDGTTTAALVQFTARLASQYQYVNAPAALSTGTYTGSLYFKAADAPSVGSKIDIWQFDGAVKNLATVTLTTAWQRLATTGVSSLTATGAVEADTFGRAASAGGGSTAAVNIYVAAGQIETGAFATSYIPTTTVAVARAADVITFNSVVPFANGFGAFIDVRAIPSFAATVYYLAAAAGNRIFYSSSNANLSTYNGTTVLSADPLSGNLSSGFRGAARYKTSDRAIAVNSGTVATDANTNGVPGTVYIGSLNGTGSQNTYTKRITVFQTLSNVQIGALAQ